MTPAQTPAQTPARTWPEISSRVLWVDLGQGTTEGREEELPRPLGLGGKALALSLLERELDPAVDPLAPENLVILTSSEMAGYAFPGSNRGGMYTKSPLTGRFLETSGGGSWSRALREAGWDAVVLRGASSEPIHLQITEEGGKLVSAADLWGADVFEADDLLAGMADRRTARLVIGTAGENGVTYASVHNDKFHAMGRGGLGAVLGAKRLKAITVHSPGSSKQGEVGEAFASARRKVTGEAGGSPTAQAYRRLGTPMLVALMNEAGGFPSAYWQSGEVAHRERLEAEGYSDWAEVKTENCPPCPMRCRKRLEVKAGPYAGHAFHGPEYETIYAFGGLCLIEDPQQVAALHEECNRLGMDTITAGNAVALAMELGKRGIRQDAPVYGDFSGTMRLLGEVAGGSTELGRSLAKGTRIAAEELGFGEEAVQVKGMEPAGYDPRATRGMDLAYATSPRGACHLPATFYKPTLSGLTQDLDETELAELFTDYEDRLFLHDCLTMCRFYRDCLDWPTLQAMVGELAGRPVELPELREVVRGLLTRVRRLNFAMGMTAAEDRLPRRFFEEELERAPALDEGEFKRTLAAYYAVRGWPEGVPS